MKQVLFILLVFISFQGFAQLQTVKLKEIGLEIGLEVMTKDLGQMKWYDALKVCHELKSSEEGYNWRLPTKYEYDILFKNKEKIGGFKDGYYWCGEQCGTESAWIIDLTDGYWRDGYNDGLSLYEHKYYVRAVRTLK